MEDKNTMLLFGLVYSLQMTVMQHLGKIKNPMNEKIERSLPDAEATIDMLEMLHVKTKGNLSTEEENVIINVLRDLKLNYVDELSKEPKQ